MFKAIPDRRFSRAVAAVLLVAAGGTVSGCNDVQAAPETSSPQAELVMLRDGSTMVAREGTLSREIADWLDADGPASRSFALGSDAFIPDSAQLSPAGLGRAVDLGTMLRANPGAKLVLDKGASHDDKLADARAAALARFLGQRGIMKGQVSVAPSEEASSATSALAQPWSLSFRLDRGAAADAMNTPA